MDQIILKYIDIARNDVNLDTIVDCKEKVDYLLRNTYLFQQIKREVCNVLEEYQKSHLKSALQSTSHYRRGVYYYKKGEYDLAIDSYSLAIMNAPFPSKNSGHHLLYALVSRSHVFSRVKNFESALFDANRALELHVSTEIIKQKVNCLVLLKRFQEAVDTIESYINSMSDTVVVQYLSKLRLSVKRYIGNDATKAIEESNEVKGVDPVRDRRAYIHKNIEMKLSPTNGRYYIAKNDIPNETFIMGEKFLISCYTTSSMRYHCGYCSKVLDSHFWPCEWCNEVVFCDPKCAVKSLSLYHHYECGIAGLLGNMNLNALIEYRCFTRVGCDAAIDYEQTNKDKSVTQILESVVKDFEQQNIRFSENKLYQRLMTMIDNNEKYSSSSNTVALIYATVVTLVLEYRKAIAFDGQIAKISEFILIAMNMAKRVYVNTFGIWEYIQNESQSENQTKSLRGTGIAYWANYFNHSCNPNVIWRTQNEGLVFVTARDIRAGEELNITYGSLYYKDRVEKRQPHLSYRYLFQCRCDVCRCELQQHHPLKCLKCDAGIVFYDNSSTQAKCNICSKDYDHFKSAINFIGITRKNINLMLNRIQNFIEVDLSVKVVEDLITKLSAVVCDNSIEMLRLKRQIAKACDSVGRYDLAIKYAQQSVPLNLTDEELFGRGDIAYLADVWIKYLDQKKVVEESDKRVCIDWNLKLIDAGKKFLTKHRIENDSLMLMNMVSPQLIKERKILDSVQHYLKQKEMVVKSLLNCYYFNF